MNSDKVTNALHLGNFELNWIFACTFFRSSITTPALYVGGIHYSNSDTVLVFRIKMGTKIYGETKTIQHRTNFTVLQLFSSSLQFLHCRLCE